MRTPSSGFILILMVIIGTIGIWNIPGSDTAFVWPDLTTTTTAPAPTAPRGELIAVPPQRWCIYGDSLTVGAHDALIEQFGIETVIEAKSARNIAQAWPGMEAGPTDCQVAIALGTNNLSYEQADSEQLIRDTLDRFDQPVKWVNVYAAKYTGQQDRFNAALTTVAAEQPDKLQILDWAGFIAGHPAWQAPDGIHLDAEGYRQRGAWFKAQLAP